MNKFNLKDFDSSSVKISYFDDSSSVKISSLGEKNDCNCGGDEFTKEATKRIRDRGIHWKEVYREKSAPLKKRFDGEIGPGAYHRWEGHDFTTGSDYFVIVGPSITRFGMKTFFAGIKKLPPKERRQKVYAPDGEYFPSIMSALSHVRERWGVPFPSEQKNYSQADLENVKIPRHMKG